MKTNTFYILFFLLWLFCISFILHKRNDIDNIECINTVYDLQKEFRLKFKPNHKITDCFIKNNFLYIVTTDTITNDTYNYTFYTK